MSGNKIKRDLPNNEYQAAVGANSPSASNVFATIADLTSSGGIQHGIAAGTNTYTVAIPGVVSYTDGDSYIVRFTNGNDDDSTININGLGAVTLVKQANVQVTGGDILSGQELLLVYDGTNFQCIEVSPNQLFAFVTNDEAIPITKGQPVYAFSSTGNRMTVKLAYNTSDSTSAQTIGLVYSSSIGANQTGFIIVQGVISGIDTSMYAAGDQLYLGATAGTLTNVKPYAPNHLVYIGIVERTNAGNGQIYVRTQNGYELGELHDVDLITTPPAIGDALIFNGSLWVPGSAAFPFGRFGIADSNGQYTYYADLTTAMAAAVAGQTIEQFADIIESNNVTITLKDGVNINMNGHTYTSTYSAAAITLFTAGLVKMLFHNGNIVIDSGSVSTIGLSVSSAAADIDCTGLYIKVISSGGTGICFSGRGGIKNLRGLSIADDCARIFRGSASNCIFDAVEGVGVVLGTTTVGTAGTLSNSSVSSIVAYFDSPVIDCTTGTASIYGATMRGGSAGTLLADTEYSPGNSNNCYISNVTSGAVTLRAFNASLFMRGCTVFATLDSVTITDDTNDNCYITNNTLHTGNAANYCITKAAGVNLVVYANYANNAFIGATTPIATTVLQNIVNTQDNQGNILSE